MNVIDSPGWIEYFIDGPNAAFFAPAIEDIPHLIVPAITLMEVFQAALKKQSEGEALKAIAQMKLGQICELTEAIALSAAKVQHEFNLPLVNSIILATAWTQNAKLWTQDEAFRHIEGVQYRKAKNG